jgi:hypothetical protein
MIQRIRTLQRIARKWSAIPCGTVLHIPDDLDEATALSWLKGGLAEEDKMIDRVPEIKDDGPVSVFKKIKRARRK